ncbi:MAG: diaminopimelate epimerase [Planctomycetota bacterium]
MTAANVRFGFAKMHGAGNDYVMVDGFDHPQVIERGSEIAKSVSDRRFGIGSDGLITLGPSTVADVRMWMWNADGSRGAMCGNGLRMLACFARERTRVARDGFLIETDSGVQSVTAHRDREGRWIGARVTMPTVEIAEHSERIATDTMSAEFWEVDVGNPHAVVLVDSDPESLPLAELAAALRRLARFPDGVNVELVRVDSSDTLRQRTDERGSGETMACGSGATASAMVAMRLGRLRGPTAAVDMRGGRVLVHRIDDRHAELEGPVVTVFRGSFG